MERQVFSEDTHFLPDSSRAICKNSQQEITPCCRKCHCDFFASTLLRASRVPAKIQSGVIGDGRRSTADAEAASAICVRCYRFLLTLVADAACHWHTRRRRARRRSTALGGQMS